MIVVDTIEKHIRYVVDNLCAEDLEEQFVCAFDGDDTKAALAGALIAAAPRAIAYYTLAVSRYEPPIALIGAWLASPRVATIHQIRTAAWPAIGRQAHRFYRREFIPKVLEPNVRLAECRVLASHAASRRWMRSLGFEEHGSPLPYGSRGEDLVQCVWRNRKSDFSEIPAAPPALHASSRA